MSNTCRYFRQILCMNFIAGLTVLIALLATSPCSAIGYFYGVDGFTSDLVLINTIDGTSTVIGHMAGVENGLGLAFDVTTNKMYTRDFNSLFTVDISNASASEVGLSGTAITSLAFSNDYSVLYSFNQFNGSFYHINPANGMATLVGNTGINTPLDMTMSATGDLWAANHAGSLYKINPSNGAATLMWSIVDDRGLTSIQFDSLDNLYGVTAHLDMLVKINISNGVVTNVGGPIVRGDIRGMAFLPESYVPEPASLAMLAIGFFGLLVRSRI